MQKQLSNLGQALLALMFILSGGQAQAGLNNEAIRLSPKLRPDLVAESHPNLERAMVQQALESVRIFNNQQEYQSAATLISCEPGHAMAEIGAKILVANLKNQKPGNFDIYRKLKDHQKNKEFLGTEAVRVGKARLYQAGEPAVLEVIALDDVVEIDQKVLPASHEAQLTKPIAMHKVARPLKGRIISMGGRDMAAPFHWVLLDLGAREGLEAGNTLKILKGNKDSRGVGDPEIAKDAAWPEMGVGTAIVIKTYEKMSLAFVSASDLDISLQDEVASP